MVAISCVVPLDTAPSQPRFSRAVSTLHLRLQAAKAWAGAFRAKAETTVESAETAAEAVAVEAVAEAAEAVGTDTLSQLEDAGAFTNADPTGTGAPSDLKEDALNERSPLDATTVPPEEPLPTFPAPAPLPPLSTAAEARRRQDPEAIWELLAREHGSDPPMLEVKLLRASWLLGPTQSARRFEHSGRDLLPRRQWLEAREPDAYISLKELRALHDLHDKGRAGGDTDEANAAPRLLPIVAVAMAWLAADHPDPDGETIDLIAALLAEKRRTRGRHTAGTLLGGKTAPAASTAAASAASASAAASAAGADELEAEDGTGGNEDGTGGNEDGIGGNELLPDEFGIFLPWCSLPQPDNSGVRSPIERVAFEGAMASLDLWYTHALTTALLVHPPDTARRPWLAPQPEWAVGGGWPTLERVTLLLQGKRAVSTCQGRWAQLLDLHARVATGAAEESAGAGAGTSPGVGAGADSGTRNAATLAALGTAPVVVCFASRDMAEAAMKAIFESESAALGLMQPLSPVPTTYSGAARAEREAARAERAAARDDAKAAWLRAQILPDLPDQKPLLSGAQGAPGTTPRPPASVTLSATRPAKEIAVVSYPPVKPPPYLILPSEPEAAPPSASNEPQTRTHSDSLWRPYARLSDGDLAASIEALERKKANGAAAAAAAASLLEAAIEAELHGTREELRRMKEAIRESETAGAAAPREVAAAAEADKVEADKAEAERLAAVERLRGYGGLKPWEKRELDDLSAEKRLRKELADAATAAAADPAAAERLAANAAAERLAADTAAELAKATWLYRRTMGEEQARLAARSDRERERLKNHFEAMLEAQRQRAYDARVNHAASIFYRQAYQLHTLELFRRAVLGTFAAAAAHEALCLVRPDSGWDDEHNCNLAAMLPFLTRAGPRAERPSQASWLRRLVLSGMRLGDNGLRALSESAVGMGVLRRVFVLNLSENRVGDAGMSALAVALSSGALPALKELHLSLNRIGDEGLLAFAARLSAGALPQLTTLCLDSNQLADMALVALGTMLANGAMGALMTLDLAGNRITDEGLTALLRTGTHERTGMSALSQLRTLDLSANRLGTGLPPSPPASDLSRNGDGHRLPPSPPVPAAVGEESKLPTVRPDVGFARDPGVATLAAALGVGHMALLNTLRLSGNVIGDDGARALALAAQRGGCPRLQELWLCDNRITEIGLHALSAAAADGRYFPRLATLQLHGNVPATAGVGEGAVSAAEPSEVVLGAVLGATSSAVPVVPSSHEEDEPKTQFKSMRSLDLRHPTLPQGAWTGALRD
jgi:hypothetical protein